MKCVCGHNGNDFIELNVTAEETFFACPKCGTLKIEIAKNVSPGISAEERARLNKLGQENAIKL